VRHALGTAGRRGANHALDLRDHDAAAVASSKRLVHGAEQRAFVFVGQVPALVGGGRAQDGHARRDRRVEQPLLTGE
jgi:hypothetical protein